MRLEENSTDGTVIIASAPLVELVRQHRAEAHTLKSYGHLEPASLLLRVAIQIEDAIRAGANIEAVSTSAAAALLEVKPDSVATACRRGRFRGARKVAGQWRIPVAALQLREPS
jgi:hypothetical protein